MANSIAKVEKYLTKVIDEVYFQESLTDRFFRDNAIIAEWTDGRTAKVFSLASTGYTNYNRGGSGNSNADGAVNSSLQSFTLSQERYSSIPVDRLDSIDDMGVVIGHLAKQFANTKHTPELDTYRLSKLAGYTSTTLGNRVVETIAANTIISKFNAAFKYMKNHKVPSENQILFVSPTVMELIRNTSELYKKLTQEEYQGKIGDKGVTFSIEKYEGREIVEVPEDEFYTDVVIGNGYYPAAGSKIINFLVVDKQAPIAVQHLAWTKVYDSDQTDLGFVGNKLANLLYHDLFVPDNKVLGVYASVSQVSADTIANELLVVASAGAAQGKTKVDKVITNPEGIIYDALYRSTSATKPAINSATAGLTAVSIGAEFTPDASHNFIVASYNGKAVAVSKDFTNTLPVGQ